MHNEKVKVALIGNPNSGKTSVFNHLTGLRQKVGNFPGVTVDKKTGKTALPDGRVAEIIDLPGAYSVYPNSEDERILLNVLSDPARTLFPDLVVYVADASNLERHLLLCSQIIDIGLPVILTLNMVDVSESEGTTWDTESLASSLGIPVIPINGRSGEGIEALKTQLTKIPESIKTFYPTHHLAPEVIDAIKAKIGLDNDYHALLVAHHNEKLIYFSQSQKQTVRDVLKVHEFPSIRLQVEETMARFEKIKAIIKKAATVSHTIDKSFTEKLDQILTHKVFGTIIFLGILFLIFQAIFSWAIYPMDWIDLGFSKLASLTHKTLPEGVINNLISQGIIPGLGGICIFIPQITILFGLIAFLDDIGYMSRAVYLSDSIMRKFGLNGRSVVSLFSGLACAVPAIMATRTIHNWKERLTTIMVTPLMSCSARIPVYVILVSFAVPREMIGPFNLQGIAMMGLYVLGAAAALVAAFVMKFIIKTGEHSFLAMELPTYKAPYWKNIFFTMIEKVKIFILEAGKVILVISIILWVLSSYGPPAEMQQAEQSVISEYEGKLPENQLQDKIAAKKIEASFAGHLGKFIEPVIKPLGFDWKIGIALITSFAAREVFVGTIATIYSVGSSDDEVTIRERMKSEINPATGQMVYNPATALSLLIFYVFAMQCMSTLAIVYRETKSWKWPAIQFTYMTVLAYVGSLIAFNLMK